MLIRDCVSFQLQKYKTEHQLSTDALSKQLGVAKSSLHEYIKGRGNLRADTIELIADNMGISLSEMFSTPMTGQESAERVIQAAMELGGLPPEQKETGVELFLALVSLFSK